MYYVTNIQRTAEKEILASEKVAAFTGTVVPDGVEADADGKRVVHRGNLMAESGKVVTVTAAGGCRVFFGRAGGDPEGSGGCHFNAKFNDMPMTWGQIWQSMQNTALIAFQLVLQRVNDSD